MTEKNNVLITLKKLIEYGILKEHHYAEEILNTLVKILIFLVKWLLLMLRGLSLMEFLLV